MIAGSLTALATPWMAGQFSNALIQGESQLDLSVTTTLIIIGVFVAAQSFLRFLVQYVLGDVSGRISADLRVLVYDKLQALPLDYHQEEKRGEVLSLITNDVEVITDFITGPLISLTPTIVTFVGALLIVVAVDPFIGMLICALAPFFYLVMKLTGRRIQPISRALMDGYGENYGRAYENLTLLALIKAYVQEASVSENYKASNDELVELNRQQVLLQSMLSPIVQFSGTSGLLILLWYGIGLYYGSGVSPGEIVSLVLYGMLLTRPISGFADIYGVFIAVKGASERLANLLGEPDEANRGDLRIHGVDKSIEFSNIDFGYPGRQPVFNNLNLSIKAGEVVAITGPNGAGKSTLVNLLTRFVSPQAGRILIDGIDINSIRLQNLRQQIAFVHQDALVLNASIRDNILFGRPAATDSELKYASEAALVANFAGKLPLGLDTPIGDEGMLISGGEKQRVVLARALLADRPVLILDESTSMFDLEAEQQIVATLRVALAGKTAFLITHRPAILALADRLISLPVPNENHLEGSILG